MKKYMEYQRRGRHRIEIDFDIHIYDLIRFDSLLGYEDAKYGVPMEIYVRVVYPDKGEIIYLAEDKFLDGGSC